MDTSESVSQEKNSSPKTSALLHAIPENETAGQDDVVDGLEAFNGILANILREPNVIEDLNVDLEVGVHENQYENADAEIDNPPNEVPNHDIDQDGRRPVRNCRYFKHKKK